MRAIKTIAGDVAFAAITRRRRYRATDRGSYLILLTNGVVVFAPDPLALYDAKAVAIVTQRIGVGSTVRISVDAAGWMTTVQIVSLVSACRFQPVVNVEVGGTEPKMSGDAFGSALLSLNIDATPWRIE